LLRAPGAAFISSTRNFARIYGLSEKGTAIAGLGLFMRRLRKIFLKEKWQMESLNDRLVAEREAQSFTSRLEMAQGRLALKLRRAAARICEPETDHEAFNQMSAVQALGAQANVVLNKTADYIERVDAKALKSDVTKQVQHHPGASLLVAGAAGFLLSSMFRRR
jgi:hypothetical protein